ncbi:hypothetical protein Tco_0029661, partial [Tanacetum coccineum]
MESTGFTSLQDVHSIAELESYVEEPSMGPRAPQQQQHTQAISPFTNS